MKRLPLASLRHASTSGILFLVLAGLAQAQEKEVAKPAPEPRKFIRIERGSDDEPLALQTSIVHFTPEKADQGNLVVDLIGAVHVGEKSYYEALNKQFEQYDVVLFEMVAPEGTQIPKGTKTSGHPVAMLQNGLKGMLALEHQLEHVDYTKKNMVHADMSPDDFAKSMEERKESFATMFFRMMGQAMAQQSNPTAKKSRASDFDLISAFFDRDRAGSLKRVMAEQFEGVEGAMQALEGPGGSTIITERNKVALKKLSEQIAAGKKRIAIFYGAGHLNDMEKRLHDEFHLKRGSEEWITAWKLGEPEAKPAAEIKKKAA